MKAIILLISLLAVVVFVSGCTAPISPETPPPLPQPPTGDAALSEQQALQTIEGEIEQAVEDIDLTDIENAITDI